MKNNKMSVCVAYGIAQTSELLGHNPSIGSTKDARRIDTQRLMLYTMIGDVGLFEC